MRPRFVIIPAGGTGSRMGSEVPKQMLDLMGKPVLRRTVELSEICLSKWVSSYRSIRP